MSDPSGRLLISWPLGQTDYLRAKINLTDADGNPVTIADNMDVAFTFDRQTFIPGQWLGTAASTRVCRTTEPITDDDIPEGAQALDVFVRITDDPTIPYADVGTLEII